MRPHPLRGAARWLVLPAVSIVGGALAGGMGGAFANIDHPKGVPWPAICGACLAGAAAVGAAASTRLWLNLLIAGLLALVGWAWSFSWQAIYGPLDYYRDALKPSGDHVLTASLTLPYVLLFALRARGVWYVSGLLTVPVAWWFAYRRWTLVLLTISALLPLVHYGAREIARRMSSSAPDVG